MRCLQGVMLTNRMIFSSDLLSIYDSFCPIKTVKLKNLDVKKPYITSEIKQLLKEKHRLKKKYNKYPITYGREYRLLRNSLNSRIRTAKKMYFRSEFRDTRDTKAAWKVINGLLGREQKIRLPDCFYVSGHLVSDHIFLLQRNLAISFQILAVNLLNSFHQRMISKIT